MFISCEFLAFLSAAGFASSSVLFNLGDPPFLHDAYAVAPFRVCDYLTTIGGMLTPLWCLRYQQMWPPMVQSLRTRPPLKQIRTAILQRLYPPPFSVGLVGKTMPATMGALSPIP